MFHLLDEATRNEAPQGSRGRNDSVEHRWRIRWRHVDELDEITHGLDIRDRCPIRQVSGCLDAIPHSVLRRKAQQHNQLRRAFTKDRSALSHNEITNREYLQSDNVCFIRGHKHLFKT